MKNFKSKFGNDLIIDIAKMAQTNTNEEDNLAELMLTQDEINYIIDSIGIRRNLESLEQEKITLLEKFLESDTKIREIVEVYA